MANVEHSALTSSELHEPKGADTASDGDIYISNGAGSGVWTEFPTGWGFYKDDAAAQTFNTTAAKLSIDAAGSTTDEDYLPRAIRGSDSLWDSTNDKITPVALGDSYDVRLDLPCTASSGSPNSFLVELDIGGGSSPSDVVYEVRVDVPSSFSTTVSVGLPFFVSSSFVSNGGQIFVTTDTGTLDITAPAIFLSRNHSGAI